MLRIQSIEPGDLLWPVQRRGRTFSKVAKVGGVGLLRSPRLAAFSQPLQRILANGLQHREARLAIISDETLHHLLLEQRLEPVEDTDRERSHRSGDLLGGLERPATGEDRQAPK